MIRFFDIVIAGLGLLLLSPVLLVLCVLICLESSGCPIYRQERIGRDRIPFMLYKLRSMYKDSDRRHSITIGCRDARITGMGHFLRRYKLDELPQLFNVLKGDMSLVGPRPEVRKYVDLYTEEQFRVLSVRPGITDYASIEYVNESVILGQADDA